MNIGKSLIKLQTVDSTNLYATKLIRQQPVTEGTVILAVNQTKGKGQTGNVWESEPGKNLTLSLILYPVFLNALDQFYLSMCISNAIHDFIKSYQLPAKIKWPNDIYVNQKKIGGILIENSIMQQKLNSSVIGIGLNINQKSFGNDLQNATSICIETGHESSLENALETLFSNLNVWISCLYKELYSEIKVKYLNNMLLINEWACYTDSQGKFEGRIVDIGESGTLMVKKRNDEIRAFSFKEIVFPV